MRNYVPEDDDPDPADYDICYDVPATTDKGLAARFYITIERDPAKAARLDQRQNAAILELLRWAHENRDQMGAEGHGI